MGGQRGLQPRSDLETGDRIGRIAERAGQLPFDLAQGWNRVRINREADAGAVAVILIRAAAVECSRNTEGLIPSGDGIMDDTVGMRTDARP